MNKKIFIFDIDGTILPDIISNRGDWNSYPPMYIVNQIIEEGSHIRLFPGFIEYFKSRCRHAEKVYFVTGRGQKNFLAMTIFQLCPIVYDVGKHIEMIFYPDGQSFSEKIYFKWKIDTIKKIIKNHKDSIFYIYDDRVDYFKNFSKKKNIYCFNIIDGENFWLQFLLNKKEIKVKIYE